MEEIKEKQCTKCGEIKPLTEFFKHPKTKDKHNTQCKQCCKEYRLQNSETLKIKNKIYRTNNYEKRKNDLNTYREQNKDKLREYRQRYKRKKYTTDSLYAIIYRIRNRTYSAIKNNNISKESSTMKMLGCDKETLMNHLQSTGIIYDPNFNIYDYDSSLYHIDHIKTFADVAKGIYTLEEVCHYTNLQILPAEVNLSKGDTSW